MARAIWKGVIRIGSADLPVKLYSAVEDRSIHFRLLHRTDLQPVRQQLISSDSGEELEYEQVRKAYSLARGRAVVFDSEELEEIEPPPSRDIEISRFVNPEQIDHRFYQRAYYLGPDSSTASYFALAEALGRKRKEGVARWVMRKKSYVGSLRSEEGYLMLITLRHAEEIIATESLEAPGGRELSSRELAMAGQLLKALEGKFDPAEFQDEYRARVLELVAAKDRGEKVKVTPFRPKKTDEGNLANALEASLTGLKKVSGG
jgi:DNA end-binding protein Ku